MRVVIRADSRTGDGAGHVMRCLAVAQELRRRSHLVEWQLDSPALMWVRGALAASGWPDVWPDEDGASESALLHNTPDMLILDSYRVAVAWLDRVRAAGVLCVVLVDDPTPPYQADLCIAPGLSTSWRGGDQCSPGLLGLDYILIRDDIRDLQSTPVDVTQAEVPRLACVLGGSDLAGTGLELVTALRGAGVRCEIDVVGEGLGRPARWADDDGEVLVRFHSHGPDAVRLAASADLVVSGAGVAAWEFLYLGASTAILQMAENQAPNYREMTGRGWAIGLGDVRDLDSAARIVREWARRWRPSDRELPRRSRGADGLGAWRVVGEMEGLRASSGPPE